MDIWKFYDITHRDHVVCNPTNEEKLARPAERAQKRQASAKPVQRPVG